ncbi:hypothetical protein AcV5_007277 [Taiwanofungus camphoratus]|nr:hypothetical protein AcV5_007277 [Antrodia cinnamomea]
MATALQLAPPDTGPAFNEVSTGLPHINDFSNRLTITNFDLKDNRYPTLASPSKSIPSARRPAWAYDELSERPTGTSAGSRSSWVDYPAMNSTPNSWVGEKLVEGPADEERDCSPQVATPAMNQQAQSPKAEDTLPSSLPPGSPTRLIDRLSREEQLQRRPSKASSASREIRRAAVEIVPYNQDMGQRPSLLRHSQDQFGSFLQSTLRHPSLPAAGAGAGPSTSVTSPIVPLSASPSYNPSAMQVHISPNPRAYAQHPTYITPPPAQNSMNPVYVPPQVPKEEVCVECAMRDQDMADVDVTSPGVWGRESDVQYEELVHREQEEIAAGNFNPEKSSRPRARGQPLTEENLRVWTNMNPKEPSSRQQTLDQYVKSQRSLLEADALARARAMRESQLLEDRMRDTYSQLRRSAYEVGSSVQLAEDAAGGVRIKSPRSASMPSTAMAAHAQSHGREVTLLENGMIVEYVDVRKEEKEERERRRKEERRERSRARKSSRGSLADVTSVYSMPIPGQMLQTDSGFFSGVRGSDSRYSQSFSPRPSSVVTTGDRPQTLLRAYSQASFSDMQSIGSASSPRRSRFFGFKNLSSAWRSGDSLAPSGSMVDMHVALDRERQFPPPNVGVDMGGNTPTLRMGESWPQRQLLPERTDTPTTQAPKKKNGLKKIWKIVTGSASKTGTRLTGRTHSRSLDRVEDDTPLAPPPPLSYLVDRDRGTSSRRHVSTPSLPSSASPNVFSPYAASPPTAPSSLVPSPTSSRHPVGEKEAGSDSRKNSADQEHHVPSGDRNSPELDVRGRTTQGSPKTLSSSAGPQTPVTAQSIRPQSVALRRDKSLPPIPGESSVEFPDHPMPDVRPQTIYTYNHLAIPLSGDDKLLPPQAPFRTAELRRQSFGGLGSQPYSAMQSLPPKGTFSRSTFNVPPFLAEERKYGEFGASRFSLSQWQGGRVTPRSIQTPGKPRQRRSKFGLSSLFGKKSTDHDSKVGYGNADAADYAAFRTSGSDPEHGAVNGYSGPGSAHSSAPRMSVASRKNIAELVEQDTEFVAYRYPSSDQRFDLVR